ncbi:hypothetical protein BST61_g1302 [Cercospora zeina]
MPRPRAAGSIGHRAREAYWETHLASATSRTTRSGKNKAQCVNRSRTGEVSRKERKENKGANTDEEQLQSICCRDSIALKKDLLGQWSLPQDVSVTGISTGSRVLKVLIQCKLSTAQPCNVRELEGAYVGAPAGWRGDGVMAFLVSSKPATAGVRAALQRSRLPMGFLQITEQGHVRQFIWNNIAQEARLVGMSATNAYGSKSARIPEGNIALVYQGRPL